MNAAFRKIAPEYEAQLAHLTITRPATVAQRAAELVKPEVMDHYREVEAKLAIPAVVQAAIFEREASSDFRKSPAQGDRWDHISIHVPRNKGPYPSWLAAALDTFHNIDRLDDTGGEPWTMAFACYKWEVFNGLGYRAHGLPSPYVFGATSVQRPGKYVADGKFRTTNPNGSPLWDTQIGCAALALSMISLDPSLAFGPTIIKTAAPSIVPAILPVPSEFGGGLTGAKWIQATLNLVDHIDPPLDVDGSFGRETRLAVRAYQQRHGQEPTGKVDDKLCAAIDADLAALRPVT